MDYIFEPYLHCCNGAIYSNAVYPLSMSVGRQPRIQVSSVTKTAVNPAALARFRIHAVISLCSFDGQYN